MRGIPYLGREMWASKGQGTKASLIAVSLGFITRQTNMQLSAIAEIPKWASHKSLLAHS